MNLSELLSAFDPDLPLEKARTIPAAWYRDPAIYELERRTVFRDCWLMAGRAELHQPGDFLTSEIAGEPILVVRDEANELRAFFNVCRHRAAPLLTQPCGRVTRLRCRYHGWTYDLAGRLRGVPEFEGVADFRREDNGLVPLGVAAWGPLLFVHPGPVLMPLEQYLAPLPERCAGLGMERLRFVERRQYELACNWKVFVDNYLDGGYHINQVHPGLGGIVDYSRYRTEIAGHTAVQISPLRPAEDEASTPVGQVRSGACAWYWWIFPNLMLNLYEGYLDVNLVLPLGPDRCQVVFDFYFADTEGEASRQRIAESIAVAHQIQLEDVGICEEVQRGLGSAAFDVGRFSVRREAAGYEFHRLLARRLRSQAALGP